MFFRTQRQGRDAFPSRPGPPLRVGLGGLLLAELLLAAGCGQPPQPAEAPPRLRLVSTAPNLTECVCAVGAGDLLAGRTEACDYPPEAVQRVPVTGGFGTPYLEPLLAARPTHVLETVLSDPGLADRLRALRIPVVHVPCARLGDIPDALLQIGALTGHDAEAKRIAAEIRAGIAAARAQRAAPAQRPRVLLLVAPDTPITAGSNAFIAELLELAGGDNVGSASPRDYYHVSLEWVLNANPDMILCVFDTHGGDLYERFASQPGWSALAAVRGRRVYAVSELDTVSRPGPRVLEGLAYLRGVLAGDALRAGRTRERTDE